MLCTNRCAKGFGFFKKPTISFIINSIVKVVPTTGLEGLQQIVKNLCIYGVLKRSVFLVPFGKGISTLRPLFNYARK